MGSASPRRPPADGYSVLVLEQTGLASATSGRSSKLIHGGLRYLEGLHFSLVRESLRERTLLLKLAPELVHLQAFHIPIYPETSRRPMTIRAGLACMRSLAACARRTAFACCGPVNGRIWMAWIRVISRRSISISMRRRMMRR